MRWAVLFMALLASLLTWFEGKSQACCMELEPRILDRPGYQVISVYVPASSHYQVVPVVSSSLALLPDLVTKAPGKPIAGINAGFFDPSNKETTSYVVSQGKTLANPVDNRNFVENPDLYPYLEQMLNRSEFRVLECHGKRRFDIARHRDPVKRSCQKIHSLQAGPNLFEKNAAEKEAFIAYRDGKRVRDAVGIDAKNARSAIGIDQDGGVILAMAAMKPVVDGLSGVSLNEMSEIMHELGATEALSLDGGSSSTLWVGGQTYFGKLDKSFNPVKRPIKSALVVTREE